MRCLIVTISLFVAMASFAADNLIVRQKSGDTAVALSSVKEITFPAEGGVKISMSDGSSQVYAHENLYSLRFNGEVSGVSTADIANEEGGIVYDGSTVSVAGENTKISVYSLDGSQIVKGVSPCVDVTHLPSGVYIVKAGCQTAKIVK
ncbi:MAG: T9SS type A sorting domain-containing protein [Muribaculaceae bacterium]|nr:T9SS type A sorting domain-containing protein [Muribaculaceae bacterium]